MKDDNDDKVFYSMNEHLDIHIIFFVSMKTMKTQDDDLNIIGVKIYIEVLYPKYLAVLAVLWL